MAPPARLAGMSGWDGPRCSFQVASSRGGCPATRVDVSCPEPSVVVYVERDVPHRRAAERMQITLLESDRSFLRSAECAALSIVAHAGLVWVAAVGTVDGTRLPTDER